MSEDEINRKEEDDSGKEEKIQEKEKELRELEAAIAEDLRELQEDPSEDLRDIVEDKKDERRDLLEDIRELREESREEIMERKEDLRERRAELAEKIREKERKARAKVKKQDYKARERVTRINISVPPDTSEEWREWSDDLGSSVSELVRKSMKFVKNNIGDLRKLDEFEEKMEQWGDNIEKAVEKSGIEDIGKKIRIKSPSVDKERIKRRITGLVKLQKGIPINKFAQALNKSEEFAENIIYELVAEGVEGELDEGVFKFSGDAEEVLSVLFELIDNI